MAKKAECDRGLTCYDPEGATSGSGICWKVVKFAKQNAACDASFGDDACGNNDTKCLGANGAVLDDVGTGICGFFAAIEGDSCDIGQYLDGKQYCVKGLVCYDPNGATEGGGICTRVDKFAKENEACNSSFGTRACVDYDNECVGANGFELGGVGTGICTRTTPQ